MYKNLIGRVVWTKSKNFFKDEVPHLVLSDFGSALSNGEWTLHSSSDGEFSDLGGNLALRAPEIRRIRPGLNSWVNYEMADTWAAGTLAFEIFTRFVKI